MLELAQELAARGVVLRFANVKRPVREVMDRAGITEAVGEDSFYLNVDDAVCDALAGSPKAKACADVDSKVDA